MLSPCPVGPHGVFCGCSGHNRLADGEAAEHAHFALSQPLLLAERVDRRPAGAVGEQVRRHAQASHDRVGDRAIRPSGLERWGIICRIVWLGTSHQIWTIGCRRTTKPPSSGQGQGNPTWRREAECKGSGPSLTHQHRGHLVVSLRLHEPPQIRHSVLAVVPAPAGNRLLAPAAEDPSLLPAPPSLLMLPFVASAAARNLCSMGLLSPIIMSPPLPPSTKDASRRTKVSAPPFPIREEMTPIGRGSPARGPVCNQFRTYTCTGACASPSMRLCRSLNHPE